MGKETWLPEDYSKQIPREFNRMLEGVAGYNRNAPGDKQLLVSTVDIIHVMDQDTVGYLIFLASKSSSREAALDLAGTIPTVFEGKGPDELFARFDDLERRFRAVWGTFRPQNQDEIAFALSLCRASLRWEFHDGGRSSDYEEIRGEFFRKTIERALAKAKTAGGSLLCYVGGAHAMLTDWGPDDYPAGKVPEAKYFQSTYPASKGRVASILIKRINDPDPGTLDAVVLTLMAEKNRIFINLRDKHWNALSQLPAGYFLHSEPKYDAVLFLR